MDAKTLKTLEGSIIKWRKIVTGHGEDLNSDNCPLCKVFIENECEGCPVMLRTGKSSCLNTPYYEFNNAFFEESFSLIRPQQLIHDYSLMVKERETSIGPKTQAAAIKEYYFLVSLLPTKTLRQRYSDV